MNFENVDDYDFYFINNIIINDQNHAPGQDKRKQIQIPYEKSPYNAIGKLISYFQKQGDKQTKISLQGTAFYIGKNLLLTVAHNICNKFNKPAEQVYFYPAQKNGQKKIRIKAKKFKTLSSYQYNARDKYGPNIFDLALIQLQENSQFKRIKPLKIKWDYKLAAKPNSKLILAGYPSKQNQHPQSCYMYEDQNNASFQDQFYIYYKHSTSGGQSGMPIIQIDAQHKFWLIGVHKAQMQYNDKSDKNQNKIIKIPNQKKFNSRINFGLNLQTLKSTKERICELAQQMKVQQLLGQNYEPSYKRILQENNMLKKENQSLRNKVQCYSIEQIQKYKKQNQKLKKLIQQLQKQLNQSQQQLKLKLAIIKQNKQYKFIQNEYAKQLYFIILYYNYNYKQIENTMLLYQMHIKLSNIIIIIIIIYIIIVIII